MSDLFGLCRKAVCALRSLWYTINLCNTKIGPIFPEGQSSLHHFWMQSLLHGTLIHLILSFWFIFSQRLFTAWQEEGWPLGHEVSKIGHIVPF